MNRAVNGSVLLIVFLVLTIITLWLTCLYRTALYMNNVVLAKQNYEQQFRLAESLLEYGIGAAQFLSARLKDGSLSSAVCRFDEWPPREKNNVRNRIGRYSGNIIIRKKKDDIKINAQLMKNELCICAMHCRLQEFNDSSDSSNNDMPQHFVVKEWALDT